MKKMNKKGFTLIELLAIIVILAIIAVITVPIILNIIDEARNGARKNSVIGYGKAVELAYTQYQYEASLGTGTTNSHVDTSTGDTLTANLNSGKTIAITIDGTAVKLKVDFDGDKVVCEEVAQISGESDKAYKNTIASGIITLQNCKVNDATPNYSYEGGKATTPSAKTTVTVAP